VRLWWQWTPDPYVVARTTTLNVIASCLWGTAVGIALVWLAWLWRRQVVVRSEGLSVRSWRRHWLSWPDVRSVIQYGAAGVAIVTDSAAWPVPLRFRWGPNPSAALLLDEAFSPICDGRLREGVAPAAALTWTEDRPRPNQDPKVLNRSAASARPGEALDDGEVFRLRGQRRALWSVAGAALALVVVFVIEVPSLRPMTSDQLTRTAGYPAEIPGTITKGTDHAGEGGGDGPGRSATRLDFRYDIDGVEHQANSEVSSGRKYHDGVPVTVVVDLRQPDRAIVKGESAPNSSPFGLDIFVGPLTALVLLAALITIIVATAKLRRNRSQSDRQLLDS